MGNDANLMLLEKSQSKVVAITSSDILQDHDAKPKHGSVEKWLSPIAAAKDNIEKAQR